MNKLEPCPCGGTPEVKTQTSWSGGGRYKGATRSESWQVRCTKCDDYAYSHYACMSEKAAINAWNHKIVKERNRKAAPDKLLHDLEIKAKEKYGGYESLVAKGLVRLLKDVAHIKSKMNKSTYPGKR